VNPTTGAETELSANTLAVNATSELFAEPFDVAVVGSSPSGSNAEEPGTGGSGGSNGGSGGSTGGAGGTAGGSGGSSGSSTGGAGALALGQRSLTGPRVSSVSETRRTIARRGRRRMRSTVLSFTLSEAASVKITFSHPAARFCRRSARRTRRSCSRVSMVRTLALAGRAGDNRVPMTARLAGGETLPAGRYEITLSAGSSSGSTTDADALALVVR
jgi:hypothetical protein